MEKVYIEFAEKINVYFHDIENDTWKNESYSKDNDSLEEICDSLISKNNVYVNNVESYKSYLNEIIKYYEKELEAVKDFVKSGFREKSILKIEKKLTNLNKLSKISIDKSEKIDLRGRFLEGKLLECRCVKEFFIDDNCNDEVYSYHTFLFPFRIVLDPLKKDKKNYYWMKLDQIQNDS